MSEYQEVTKTEWKKSLLLIVPLVVIVSLGAFLIPDHWVAFTALVVVTMAVIIIAAIQDAGNVMFKCPKCGQEFEISALKNAISPHGVTKKEGKWYEWKHLECPVCHEKSKMLPVKG